MDIKSLSPKSVVIRLWSAIVRFPLVFLACIFLASVASATYWDEVFGPFAWSPETFDRLITLVLLSALSLPLLSGAQLYREARSLRPSIYAVLCVVIVVLLGVYEWFLPPPSDFVWKDYFQYASASILAWFLFLCAPATRHSAVRQHPWSYGAVVVILCIFAVVFSGILWGGVSLAWVDRHLFI